MIDDVDKVILRELIKNSRISYRDLSKLVGLTDVAIIKRIRKLESSNIIKRYTAIVNPHALGYSKVSFTGINVSPDKLFDVVRALREKDYVKYLAIVSGDHNILAVIWAHTAEELDKIHEEIRRIDGVLTVYPALLSEIIKDEAYI